jgi:hypothetical protein
MFDPARAEKNTRLLLMGNDAVARGAMDAGVRVVAVFLSGILAQGPEPVEGRTSGNLEESWDPLKS